MRASLPEAEAADLAACRAMLRQGSRSFAAAAHLLPADVRDPAVALYAFCRAADDVVDRDGLGQAGVASLRQRLALIYAGRPLPMPADRAFARVVDRFALPRILPEALLEGFAWDVEGRRYADLSALRGYAVRVAGTVGAMMAVLMGVRDTPRLARAIDLGVAMQLFNIARDVGEDARAGRLYLPTAWLEEAGICPVRFLAAPTHTPALGQVVRRLLDTATAQAQSAQPGIARLPMACRFGIGAASLLYAEIGAEVARRGLDAVTARAVVSSRRKAWVLARDLAGHAWSWQAPTACVMREAAWLVDAVAQTPPRSLAAPAWWNIADRARTFIDLLERLEQRERVRL
jgi:phytoene synthase